MKNNKGFYVFLCLIISIATQRVLDLVGVSKISISFIVIVLMTSSIAFTTVVIRKNAFGGKLNIISSIIMLMMGFCLSFSIILIEGIPQFSDKHIMLTLIIVSLGVLSFFAAVIFWIWNAKKYSKR